MTLTKAEYHVESEHRHKVALATSKILLASIELSNAKVVHNIVFTHK